MKVGSKAPDDNRVSRRLPPRRWSVVSLVVALTGLVFAFPIAYLAWGTLSLGGDFWATLIDPETIEPLINSLLIATTTAAACAVVGTVLAWFVARTDLPGSRLWRVILPLPLVIPSFVGATALLSAFGPGGLVPFVPRVEGFWGAFLVMTLLSYPFVYLPVVARLSTTAPSLEEASMLLSGSHVKRLAKVVFPQVRNTVLAGTMLVFLYALSDFGAVSIMRFDTITRAIFSSRLFDRATSLTLGLILAILALGVVAIERTVAGRRTLAPTIGTDQVTYRLGRWILPVVLFVVLVVGLALVSPLAVFIVWVVRGATTVGVGYSGLGDSMAFLVRPALNSALAATVSGVVAVVVLLPVAFVAARRPSRASDIAGSIVTSVFALPGLVIALAVVFWAIQAPGPLAVVYQSFPLLIFAYVLHFGAQSMRATESAVKDVPKAYEDVARTLGADHRRRFQEIDLPLVAPGLIAGGGLVLLSTIKELPATLLLAPIGFQTLATKIWGAAEDGFYAEVGITSLVLILLSGVLTWFFVLKRELTS